MDFKRKSLYSCDEGLLNKSCIDHNDTVLDDRDKLKDSLNMQSLFVDSKFYSIMYSNVDSLLNKKNEIISRIDEFKPDIIGLTEIRAKNYGYEPLDAEFNLCDYDMFINKKVKRGVALYFNKNLHAQECTVLNENNFEESLWCNFVAGDGSKILIGCIYKSPNSTKENIELLHSILRSNEIQKFDKVCILGDFNYPDINWDGEWTGDLNNNFIECINDAFLSQKVREPTRHRQGQRPTTVDLVLVNDNDLISNIHHLAPFGKSDHDVLAFQLYVTRQQCPLQNKYKYNLKKGDYDNLREFISCQEFKGDDIENLWLQIKDAILLGIDLYIPKINYNKEKKHKPVWLSKNVLRNIKKKYYTYKRYLQSKSGKDYQSYISVRNSCNKTIKKAKKAYEKDIAVNCKTDPKRFWKYVQERTKVNNDVCTLKKDDGTFAVSEQDKAEVLNKYFASVFTVEKDANNITLDMNCKSGGTGVTDVRVTPEAVEKKLKELNQSKAQGPDNIPSKVLKELSKELAIPLCKLFNLSLESGWIVCLFASTPRI